MDEDGNPSVVAKSSKTGRPAGSKNKPSTALGSASTALGSEPNEPKKRGRPPGSRNKPKPNELTETAGRGRGRGKGRGRSRRKMVRLYASAESGFSSDSDTAPMQSAAVSFSPQVGEEGVNIKHVTCLQLEDWVEGHKKATLLP